MTGGHPVHGQRLSRNFDQTPCAVRLQGLEIPLSPGNGDHAEGNFCNRKRRRATGATSGRSKDNQRWFVRRKVC
jgi:hypothetical protein